MEQRATTAGVTWFVADPDTDELLGSLALFDLKPGRDARGRLLDPPGRPRQAA